MGSESFFPRRPKYAHDSDGKTTLTPLFEARLREAGFEPDNPIVQQLLQLAQQLTGFPRHLSQHVGGFVITRDALERMVPVENAAMPERTVIQWDKDDLACHWAC